MFFLLEENTSWQQQWQKKSVNCFNLMTSKHSELCGKPGAGLTGVEWQQWEDATCQTSFKLSSQRWMISSYTFWIGSSWIRLKHYNARLCLAGLVLVCEGDLQQWPAAKPVFHCKPHLVSNIYVRKLTSAIFGKNLRLFWSVVWSYNNDGRKLPVFEIYCLSSFLGPGLKQLCKGFLTARWLSLFLVCDRDLQGSYLWNPVSHLKLSPATKAFRCG